MLLSAVLYIALAAGAQEAEVPTAAPQAERLESIKELLGLVEACEGGQPVGPAAKDRAWTALWKSEHALSPRVVDLLRALLLKLDEENGPLEGLPRRNQVSPETEAAEARERVRLINSALALGYPPRFEALITLIARRAELSDARVALETLRRERPDIELESEGLDYASVGALSGAERPLIRLKPGVALAPAAAADEEALQVSDGERRYWPVPGSEGAYLRLGLKAPPWQALGREAAPVRTESYYGGELLLYADGSGRHRFSDGHLAGVLLHELFHLDTRRRGGAANPHVRELRSFLPQFRFYYRLQQALGSSEFLDLNLKAYQRWLRNPVSLRYALEAAYASDPAGASDERSVFRQMEEIESVLALPEADFERLQSAARAERLGAESQRRLSELRYLVQAGAAPPGAEAAAERGLEKLKAVEAAGAQGWDYRKELRDTLARLPADAELELEARLEDLSWRDATGR